MTWPNSCNWFFLEIQWRGQNVEQTMNSASWFQVSWSHTSDQRWTTNSIAIITRPLTYILVWIFRTALTSNQHFCLIQHNRTFQIRTSSWFSSWRYGTAGGSSPAGTAEVGARTKHVIAISHSDMWFLPDDQQGFLVLDQSKQDSGLAVRCFKRGQIRNSQNQWMSITHAYVSPYFLRTHCWYWPL